MLDERLELVKVVEVLGEADLVHAPLRRDLGEPLRRVRGVVDGALSATGRRTAQVHVVVDDHASGLGRSRSRRVSTKARSDGEVTLTRRGSPSTSRTRPP